MLILIFVVPLVLAIVAAYALVRVFLWFVQLVFAAAIMLASLRAPRVRVIVQH